MGGGASAESTQKTEGLILGGAALQRCDNWLEDDRGFSR
jgi:hypothetical protein